MLRYVCQADLIISIYVHDFDNGVVMYKKDVVDSKDYSFFLSIPYYARVLAHNWLVFLRYSCQFCKSMI